MKTHRNIPFFVPHAGCPHCCVFCSQVKITGQRADKDIGTESKELRELLENAGDPGGRQSRIAFFGGSFTAIERKRMETLLSIANEYIDKGVASGIRISTRPDCIDSEILKVLKYYRVTEIELGIQSTDDKVLSASERGHTAKDSFKAAELIKNQGFSLGGQMMVGLPGADPVSELQTAKDIVSMSCDESRIYPCVVFANTKLYDMTVAGKYKPLSTEEAVARSADCYCVFLNGKVNVLRVGLHSSESLAEAPFGATHPAIGELVYSKVYENLIAERIGTARGATAKVMFRSGDISMLSGNGGEALKRIKERTCVKEIELIPSDLDRFDIKVRVSGGKDKPPPC